MKFVLVLRVLTIAACLFCIFSGDHPPAMASDQDQRQAFITSNQLAVNAEQIGQIEKHIEATDATVQRQWAKVNANDNAIAVIQNSIDQTKWWLSLIAALSGGSIVWQVRKDKKRAE